MYWIQLYHIDISDPECELSTNSANGPLPDHLSLAVVRTESVSPSSEFPLKGSGPYRPGPPHAPGSWQGQQDPYEEHAAGAYAQYPPYEDPHYQDHGSGYQDTHYQDPQYPYYSQGQHTPEQPYPHDQQSYSPAPNSDPNYPPPSPSMRPPPARASYSTDSRISNETRRMQRQETYHDAPPRSPGLAPGQPEDESRGYGGQQFDAAYDQRQEEERAHTYAPAPTPASEALRAAEFSPPPRVVQEPQHQEQDHPVTTSISTTTPSDPPSGSDHIESSTPSTEKRKKEEKSKKRVDVEVTRDSVNVLDVRFVTGS
ncbi:hypothetical protein MD484_g4057, partial [Candolleomyces efflorescens]